MKLLFVCEGLRATTARAQPWKHVIETSRRIQDLGNPISVISDGSRNAGSDEEIRGVVVKRVKRKGLLLDVNQVTREIRKEDADIVNWHASDVWSSYYLWRIGKRASKTVWTLHSGPMSISDLNNIGVREAVQLSRYWNNILNAVVPSFIIRKWVRNSETKRIITLSKRLSARLQTLMIKTGHNYIKVIPSGVDVNQFRPVNQEGARQNLDLWSKDPIVLYYGPMSSFRGVDTLLNAMPFLRRKIPSIKLLLLGRGLEGNIRVGKVFDESSIMYISRILTEDEIIQYLAAADIIALPFRFWPQVECPLTILESMAMEKTVVATCTGAIPEIISSGRNGILIRPGDSAALAKRVAELLQSPEMRRRIGRNARKHIEANYDWNEIVRQTIDVFKEAYMEK